MKISKVNKIETGYIERANKSINKEGKKPANINKSLDVEISSSGKKIVDEIKKSQSNTFTKEVEALKHKVTNGDYEISSEKIAKGLLKAMKAQGGQQ